MPPAFTLVELMIAILLLALLTSAVALSFSGRLKAARSRDSLEQLRSFDATARQFSMRYSRAVQIVFDLSANTLARREGANDDVARCQVSWPTGYWVDEVRIGNQLYANGEAASVGISPLGIGPTYAVRLRGPDYDQWIVSAGLTGIMTPVKDESTVAMLLSRATGAVR